MAIAKALTKDNEITCVMVFGENALHKIEDSQISDITKKLIGNSKKFVEGTSINYQVDSDSTITELKELIRIKIEN